MSTSDTPFESIKTELARIQSNCLYTAQGYFEAAKSAEKWGRLTSPFQLGLLGD
ncbi:hypothetical protein ACFYWN_44650 [Streptomyces sp. NPDC002917]|uniref:hypothetical protein n=1 Tax=Streptomyces sp. NPDC002917 TaxID=3364671 RepID=UPI0036CB5A80